MAGEEKVAELELQRRRKGGRNRIGGEEKVAGTELELQANSERWIGTRTNNCAPSASRRASRDMDLESLQGWAGTESARTEAEWPNCDKDFFIYILYMTSHRRTWRTRPLYCLRDSRQYYQLRAAPFATDYGVDQWRSNLPAWDVARNLLRTKRTLAESCRVQRAVSE